MAEYTWPFLTEKKLYLAYILKAEGRSGEMALPWPSSSSQRGFVRTERSSEEDCMGKTETSGVSAGGGLKQDLPNPAL